MKGLHELRANWSKRERDVMLHHPIGFSTNTDAHYLSGVFGRDFQREMENRGYDISTMRFAISPKAGNPKFRSQRPEDDAKGADGG